MGHNKSNSFIYHKNLFGDKQKNVNCRTKLQDRFDNSDNSGSNSSRINRSILSSITLNDTRRVLRESASKVSKSFNDLRTTLGSFTQRFKTSTKRRELLEEGPMTPAGATPHTFSKAVLGRTPTKLYSPFGIESPYNNPLTNKCER